MAEIKYYLRNNKAKTKSSIILIFNYDSKRFKISTSCSVNPKYWNSKKQRVKELMEYPNYQKTNDQLDKFQAIMLGIYNKYRNEGYIPEPKTLKQEFLKVQDNPIIIRIKKTCWDHFDDFVEDKIDELGYAVDYDKALRKHLKKAEEFYGLPLTFDSLKDQTKNGIPRIMKKYLETVAINSKGRKGFTKNSIGKQNKNLKAFLNWCFKNGKCQQFSLEHLPTLSENVKHQFLTSIELDKIEKLTIENINEDIVRDLFLIGCETGMRFSDLISISPEDIKGLDMYVEPIKTEGKSEKNLLILPIKDRLLRILKKYNFIPPNFDKKKGTEFNDAIRKICKDAGITEPTLRTRKEGINKVKESFKKYELLSSHTCRRSFCSIKYHEKKIPAHVVMQFSGHTTEKSFLRYLNLSAEAIANNYRDIF